MQNVIVRSDFEKIALAHEKRNTMLSRSVRFVASSRQRVFSTERVPFLLPLLRIGSVNCKLCHANATTWTTPEKGWSSRPRTDYGLKLPVGHEGLCVEGESVTLGSKQQNRPAPVATQGKRSLSPNNRLLNMSSYFVDWCVKNGHSAVVKKDLQRRQRIKNWRDKNFPENHTNNKRKYYREEYLKSDHWNKLRALMIEKYPNCAVCGQTASDVHHVKYRNLYDVEESDLRTVCRVCHTKIHRVLDSGKLRFSATRTASRWIWSFTKRTVLKLK